MAEKLCRVLTNGVLYTLKSTNWMREINGNSSKTLPDPGNTACITLKPMGHHAVTCWILCPVLMTVKNGGKTLPDPGNSSPLLTLKPVGHQSTNWMLCLVLMRKKMAEKLCRILATAALLTLKPVGHQSTNWMLRLVLMVAMAAFTSLGTTSPL